ncbi:hypothetical protein AB0J28_11740 [Streptosporangium canum]|uniref:hypothetical protein n=1 Tax=Streptosporangium canum TaxID=324952 RepID=UPI003428D63F
MRSGHDADQDRQPAAPGYRTAVLLPSPRRCGDSTPCSPHRISSSAEDIPAEAKELGEELSGVLPFVPIASPLIELGAREGHYTLDELGQ